MQSFHNQKEGIVSEALDGLVAASGGKLERFDHTSHARVVVRADWDRTKVAVISGGGSGHEPAHAGFVGEGLLTAAVCGEIFASPSVDAVLSAIVTVTGPAGCLLVVKNYTGDRLNFGLAAEKAKALGYKVEMIIVADDISIPNAKQPRGVAGTLFIHKIAGHMSEKGESLERILRTIRLANTKIRTIGVARDTCTVPGNPKIDRVAHGHVEIGLGIHGEPGIETKSFSDSRGIVHDVATRLAPYAETGGQQLLLFNNLGGLSRLECLVLFNDFLRTEVARNVKYAIGPAPLMTALDMPGFSISLIELDETYADALFAPIPSNNWPGTTEIRQPIIIVPPVPGNEKAFEPSTDYRIRSIVEKVADTCIAIESEINALDAKVGDGDTGSTFATAARATRTRMDRLPFADGAALLSALSDIKRKSMGGSSGVLFAIFFASASEAYRTTGNWTVALLSGLEAMQTYGGAQPGDRTMIDALKPALDALAGSGSIADAALEARKGADATAKMAIANAGRSSYLEAQSLIGIADPGAEAIARIFEDLGRRPEVPQM